MMWCSKCGRELKDDAIFCIYCGQRIDAPTEAKNHNERITRRSISKSRRNPENKIVYKIKKRTPFSKNFLIPIIIIIVAIVIVFFTAIGIGEYQKKSDIYKGRVDINGLLAKYGLTKVFVLEPFHQKDDIRCWCDVRRGAHHIYSIGFSSRQFTREYRYYRGEYTLGYNFRGSIEEEKEALKKISEIRSETKNFRLRSELDDAIDWMKYDISGEKLSSIASTAISENGDAYPSFKLDIKYNVEGLPTEIVSDNGRYLFAYDEKENIIKYSYTGSDTNMNDFEYQYSYDENNMINETIAKYYYMNDEIVTYTYNWDTYQVGGETRYIKNKVYERGGISYNDKYEYDIYGSLLSYRSHSDDESYDFYNEFEYEYDKNGNIIKCRNASISYSNTYGLEYNDDGNLTSISSFNEEGVLQVQLKNQYESGHLTDSQYSEIDDYEENIHVSYNFDGTIHNIKYESENDNSDYDYEYDSLGNLISQTRITNVQLYKTEYIYDSDVQYANTGKNEEIHEVSKTQMVVVPDLYGLTVAEASALLDIEGLKANAVYTDSIATPGDHVIEQDIDPGIEVEEGTVLNIVISSGD